MTAWKLAFCLEYPKRDQTYEIYTPKREDKHPRLFHLGAPLRPPPPLPGAYASVKCNKTELIFANAGIIRQKGKCLNSGISPNLKGKIRQAEPAFSDFSEPGL